MPAGWERITFSNADFQTLSGPAFGGFGSAGAKLTFLQVRQDEAGVTVLDDLEVNGIMIGGSGKAGAQEEDNDNNNGDHGHQGNNGHKGNHHDD